MADAPDPSEIYRSAEREGQRRLSMPPLEKVATGFIAGVTIVFGITALGVAQGLAEPFLGPEAARLVGALAFAIGVVFLVIGRSELFSENFFGPVAAAIAKGGAGAYAQLGRLWIVTLVLNLVGGAVLVAIMSIEGALPSSAPHALISVAEETADKGVLATFARAILAGALLALLSYMLHAVDSARARISVAYMVGFFVALGPFDHVVVSVLHLLFGLFLGAAIGVLDIGVNILIAGAGNVVGGLLLITLTHTAQVKGASAQKP